MDIDEVAFSKLQIGQSDPKGGPLEVTKSLILTPPVTEASRDMTENTYWEGLTEVERRLQREEEKYKMYNRIYVGQLSDKGDSDMDTDDLHCTYFR